MAQQVTCYKSDSGKTFDNERDAYVEDLYEYINGLINNTPVAKHIAFHMARDARARPVDQPPFIGIAPLMVKIAELTEVEQPSLPLSEPTIVVDTVMNDDEGPRLAV